MGAGELHELAKLGNKIKVELVLHEVDDALARKAADQHGMSFNEFCALALHEASRDGLRSGKR